MNSSRKSQIKPSDFSWKVALASSVGVTVFLLLFRPFGIEVNNANQLLAIAGLTPFIFLLLLILHYGFLPRINVSSSVKRGLSVTGLTAAIVLYLNLLSGDSPVKLIPLVLLVTAMVIAAIWLWRQREDLQSQIIGLKERDRSIVRDPVILEAEDGKNILKLDPASLRYVKSEGNYVSVHWYQDGSNSEQLLRATLSDIENMANGLLVRCHRSYLVNLDYADSLEGSNRNMKIVFSDGLNVPVARNRAEDVRKLALSNPQ